MMIAVFHGSDEPTHEAFQAWRRAHPNGFHMTEKAGDKFIVHGTQDKRENAVSRHCHQGGSAIRYLEDKDNCYTTARKVCSESLAELLAWAAERGHTTRNCGHCDTRKFPFPRASAT